MNRRTALFTAALFALTAAAAVASCSLRYDFTECSSDDDCRQFESDETFYTCSDNTCVSLGEQFECRGDDDCGPGETCNPSNRCVGGMADAGDTGDGGPGDADSGPENRCESTQDCLDQFGENYVCAPTESCANDPETACDPEVCRKVVQTDDGGEPTGPCTEFLLPGGEDTTFDDVVLLGSIIPTTGTFETSGEVLTNAVQLAVLEFANNAINTLDGQRIGWVQCNSEGKVESAKEAARHLISLGVPAIVGPIRSDTYKPVVADVTGEGNAEVTTIAPAATASEIRNLNSAGSLSFRIIGNDRFQAQAILDRAENLLADRSDPGITIFAKEDDYGQGLRSQLSTDVGESDTIDEDDIQFINTIDPTGENREDVGANFGSKVTEALNAQPKTDLVIFLGTEEMVELEATYITSAANNFADADPEQRRYLLSHGAISDLPSLTEKLSGNETFVPLTEGVTPNVIERNNFDPFSQRYNNTFGVNDTASAAGIGYDAAVLAQLAMAGIPEDEQITGRSVGNLISSGRLQEGDEIQLNQANKIATAKGGLRNGGTVDLVGVSGPLDFDDRGEVRPNYVGTDTGVDFDQIAEQRTFDIVPTRQWVVEESSVAGNWNDIPPSLVGFTDGGQFSADPGSAIPDDDSAGLQNSLEVSSGSCATTNVARISTDIDHPTPSELRVELESPAGETATLRADGQSSTVLNGTFPTTLLPSTGSNFSKLLGNAGDGNWTLTVTDTAAGSTGTLNSWSLLVYCS